MITHQVSVVPEALLIAAGGSIGKAAEITGAVLRHMVALGATPARGLEARASWVAVVANDSAENAGIDIVDWDPATPIPRGSLMLRCTGYSVSTTTEGT